MHELSIAMNIIDIANEQVQKVNGSTVNEIELEIGTLSGVVFNALEFAFDIAVKNTILENAKRVIHKIPARGKCVNCDFEFEINDFFAQCPECKKFNIDVIQGKELRVKSIVID